MLSTISTCPSNVITYSDENNFRKTNQQGFYSLKQNETSFYDSNYEIADRAFYATINKFTCQTKRNSYSFLENWQLHNIYSKSQQILLGIYPVKPAVLLSGDDFMFTPSFAQLEEKYNEYYLDDDDRFDDDEEDDWDKSYPDEFYNLKPCPNSNQLGNFVYFQQEEELNNKRSFYKRNSIFMAASYPSPTTSSLFQTSISDDIEKYPVFHDHLNKDTRYFDRQNVLNRYKRLNHSSPALSICIPSDSQQSLETDPSEEPGLSPCSSYDEQSTSDSSICSFSSSIFNQDEEESNEELQHSSQSSLSDDSSSYQSLSDLINSEPPSTVVSLSYGSTSNESQSDSVAIDMDMQENSNKISSYSTWYRIFVYLMCLLQMLLKFCFGKVNSSPFKKASSLAERQPLV